MRKYLLASIFMLIGICFSLETSAQSLNSSQSDNQTEAIEIQPTTRTSGPQFTESSQPLKNSKTENSSIPELSSLQNKLNLYREYPDIVGQEAIKELENLIQRKKIEIEEQH